MGRMPYMCAQCGDDYSAPGVCDICSQPFVKIEEEEGEEEQLFNEEEYN